MSVHQGRIAEIKFSMECVLRSIAVAEPKVDIHGWDFVIYSNSKFRRVQVKSTSSPRGTGYKVSSGRGSKSKTIYTKKDCDFIACFIIQRDCWFIIPIAEITGVNFGVYPDNPSHRLTKYKDAFHLLK